MDIDKEWTLFIDRDGVVNEEKFEDYIRHWDEFRFYPGVLKAFEIFNRNFGKIIMVTNQRGVARGLVKLKDLEIIHQNMLKKINESGGRIDGIYVCTELESENRKPNPGMGLQAIREFPEINLQKSMMVGNTLSDMQFGRNLGIAVNVFLPTTRKDVSLNDPLIDLVFADLISLARDLPVS